MRTLLYIMDLVRSPMQLKVLIRESAHGIVSGANCPKGRVDP